MSAAGDALSTTRRNSSADPSTATMGWLAGTTILDWACGESAMVRPVSGLLALLPVSLVGARCAGAFSDPTMLGDPAKPAPRRAPGRPSLGGRARSGAERAGVAGDGVGRPVELLDRAVGAAYDAQLLAVLAAGDDPPAVGALAGEDRRGLGAGGAGRPGLQVAVVGGEHEL